MWPLMQVWLYFSAETKGVNKTQHGWNSPLLKLHLTALPQSVCGASEIWPNKRWEDALKTNTTVNTGNEESKYI